MEIKLYEAQVASNETAKPIEGQKLVGQATEAQIAEWKSKHKYGIYAIEVDGHIGYFKNPGRHELNCALSKADKEKALYLFEELAALTFLGGSEVLLHDDQIFIGVSHELKSKLEGKKARLVNL